MAKQPIGRIEKATLSSIVTDRLRQAIIQGSFEPGTQLSEVELAKQFGVSRGPIREGLQRLTQEGLLRSEPHRGVFVPHLTDAEIEDLYRVREIVEGAALALVMHSNRGESVSHDLTRIVQQMHEAASSGKWSKVAELDMRFHLDLVRAAGSPRLSRMYSSLIDETRVLLSMTASFAGRDDLVSEHAELAELLAGADTALVQTALARHFAESLRTLRARTS